MALRAEHMLKWFKGPIPAFFYSSSFNSFSDSRQQRFFSSSINPTYLEQILYSTVVRVSKLLSLSKYIKDRALIEKKFNSK